MLVQDVLEALAEAFPLELAEDWDKPGLSVGDPGREVTGIACALDATPESVRAARARGCNVLVTHHPAFLEMPFPLTPSIPTSGLAGAVVYEAVRADVALIAMHTNLDRSPQALELCVTLMRLPYERRLQEPNGYGAVLRAQGTRLGELADRCAATFRCAPTVWGDPSRELRQVAFCSGSLGGFGAEALAQGIDCVVTGEAGYHRVSELDQGGVAVILLGHDASELPFAGLLAQTLSSGFENTRIQVIDEAPRWQAWCAGK